MAQNNNENNGKKKYKLGQMISAIIIAIIAWSAVTYTTDPDITKTMGGIKVEVVGTEQLKDKGYIVTDKENLPKVSVKVSGKRGDLIKALDNVKVVVDVSQIDAEGEANMECEVKLPTSKLTVENISETTVPVKIEKYSSKEIPVKVVQKGSIDGKIVKSEPVTPMVTVYGAESDLKYAEYAGVEVDVDGINEDTDTEVPYTIVCSEEIDAEFADIFHSGTGTVILKNTVYDAYEVPVRVIATSVHYEYLSETDTEVEPEKITIGVRGEDPIPEYVTVVLSEGDGEGEYEVINMEGVYIPENYKKVKVKPVWHSNH